jgi:hypothetical protein
LNKTRTQLVLFWSVGILFLVGTLYIVSPFVGCWYHAYSFNHFVRVQIDLPSCGTTLSEHESGPCRYILSFDDEREPRAIQFDGASLHYSYDQAKQTYEVSGVGRIADRRNVIEFAPSSVLVNGQPLPRASQPILVFVKKDGQLVSGYCDISW